MLTGVSFISSGLFWGEHAAADFPHVHDRGHFRGPRGGGHDAVAKDGSRRSADCFSGGGADDLGQRAHSRARVAGHHERVAFLSVLKQGIFRKRLDRITCFLCVLRCLNRGARMSALYPEMCYFAD